MAVTGGLSAARFIAEPLMEVTTSWVVHVGCRYSFWSLFSRDSEDGRISIIVGRKLFKHCVLGELSVVDTVSARVWAGGR